MRIVTHWRLSLVCVDSHAYACVDSHAYRDSFIHMTSLIHMCTVTHSCVHLDSFMCAPRLIRVHDCVRDGTQRVTSLSESAHSASHLTQRVTSRSESPHSASHLTQRVTSLIVAQTDRQCGCAVERGARGWGAAHRVLLHGGASGVASPTMLPRDPDKCSGACSGACSGVILERERERKKKREKERERERDK